MQKLKLKLELENVNADADANAKTKGRRVRRANVNLYFHEPFLTVMVKQVACYYVFCQTIIT